MSEPARQEVARVTGEVVQIGAASIAEVIVRAASDPSIDVGKLKQLLEMHERITARDAEIAFNQAMKAAQLEMPAVVKDAENKQTNSRYATLEAVADAIDPVIHRSGFSLSFGSDVSPLDNHYRVTCTVSHDAGHSRGYHADVPSDMFGMKGTQNKTATHGFGSTMSYGRRYLKLLIFDVKLRNQDDDGNRAGGGLVSEHQVRQLEALIKEAGADRAGFLKYLGVSELEELKAGDFRKALAGLQAKKRAATKPQDAR